MSDDTLTMLADAAAAFAKPDARRVRALRGSADGYDRATWRQMAELGWLSIQVPEAQGGLGLGLAASATLATRIGYAAFPEPFVSGAVMAPACLAGARADSCGERALASVVAGDCVAALAWQGDAGRLEIDACGVSARLTTTGATLSGSSRFVLPASADAFIVAATGSQGLEAADRFAELLAGAQVVEGHLERPVHQADQLGTDSHSALVDGMAQQLGCSGVGQTVVVRQGHIREMEPSAGAAIGTGFGADFEALSGPRHPIQGQALGTVGGHDEGIGTGGQHEAAGT